MPLMRPGMQVGPWRVEGELGRGGMAVVYRVVHVDRGVERALKVLLTRDAEVSRRTALEARVQGRLRHPNLVAVQGVLDVEGQPGIVMDYVAGPTLEAWKAGQQKPTDELFRVFRGIVEGVSEAHRAGLVHRDLKPANVLLDADGRPRVTDFGLVKVLEGEVAGQTRSGVTMGTPGFMAPEQIRRARHADQRADIFSLGCLLYWLFADKPPFTGQHSMEVLAATVSGHYPHLDALVTTAPKGVSQAVDGCLQVDVDRRLPDCATLLGLLDGRVRWKP